MESILNKVKKSDQILESDKYYWGYMYELGKAFIVPYVDEKIGLERIRNIAEIGSAEGGVLAAFMEKGAVYGLGTDIAKHRLITGKEISDLVGLNIDFIRHNILADEIPEEWTEKFDLILLRDVIEHLEDSELALKNISKLLRPGGYLLVSFPPYHSPFGGHQHTLNNLWGKLPYLHLLPEATFNNLISSGREQDIEEVKRLAEIRLTPEKFLISSKNAKYNIFSEEYYFLRPVFKMKFGLPTIKLGPCAKIPFIRNYFSLEAFYILQK